MSTRSRWLLLLGLLLCLLYPTGAAAQDTKRLAVLELSGDIPDQVLLVLSDEVRAGALTALRRMPYTVMTRENTNSLLEDMGLDSKVCATEANCEVDFGRNINAALVVSGMVVSIEGELMLTLKLYETAGGTLLAPTRITAANQRVLIDKTASAAAAMIREGLGLETPQRQRRVEQEHDLGGASSYSFDESTGFLVKFSSVPEGAAVSLDGSYFCDTPCSRELGGGSYSLEMVKARYDRHEESLEITGKRRVSVQLEPQFGWLSVETTPSGLGIAIDGKPSGKSPLRRLELAPGSYSVLLADSRWQPTGKKVSISKGAERALSLQASPREGGLVVSAVDSAGNALDLPVSIDGNSVGETPLRKKLQVGEYSVVVGGKEHRVQVRENADEELEVIQVSDSPKPDVPPEHADLNVTITFADGRTKSGHVRRTEVSKDWYGEKEWADVSGRPVITMEPYMLASGTEEHHSWSDLSVITIRPGNVASDTNCKYESDYTPWMYTCELKTTSTARTKDGRQFTIVDRHKWRFVFDDGTELEFSFHKLPARMQDDIAGLVENYAVYGQLQAQLRYDARTMVKAIRVK